MRIFFALKSKLRGATIAQWIRLRLPSCCPRFKSQAHQLRFHQFIFALCDVEKTIIIQKETGIGPLKNVVFNSLAVFYFKGQHFSFILLRTKPPSFSSFVFANVHRATADEDDSRTQRFKVEWREYESSDCHLMRNGPGTDPIKIIYRVILLFTGLELSDWWKKFIVANQNP